jgi:hypothetical protein
VRRSALAPPLRRQQVLEKIPLRFRQVAAAQDCLHRICSLESKPESRVNLFVNRA